MRAPAPERMWAVIAKSQRSRWINTWTVRRTQKDSIEAFLADWDTNNEVGTWNYWRKRGYTVQRVTVTVDEEQKEKE